MVGRRLRHGLVDIVFFALLTHAVLTGHLIPSALRDLIRGEPRDVAMVDQENAKEPLLEQELVEPASGPGEDGSLVAGYATGSLV